MKSGKDWGRKHEEGDTRTKFPDDSIESESESETEWETETKREIEPDLEVARNQVGESCGTVGDGRELAPTPLFRVERNEWVVGGGGNRGYLSRNLD